MSQSDSSPLSDIMRKRSRSVSEGFNLRAEQLTKPLGSSDAHMVQNSASTSVENIYQQLHLALVSGPINLRIPETLLVSEEGQDVLLYSDPRGSVAEYPDANPLFKFTDLCREKMEAMAGCGLSEFPLYIFYTAYSSYKVIFTPAEAEKIWNSSRDATKLLQRYIPPQSKDPSKIRIVWNRSRDIKRFLIKKRGIEALFQAPKIPKSRSFTMGNSLSRSGYLYAGRLKKQSFSPLLPYKSVLEDRLSGSDNPPQPAIETPSPPQRVRTSFLVSSRVEGDYDMEVVKTSLIQAERYLIVLKDIMGRFLVHEDEALQEVAYDVMQDIEDQYYFLNVKWVQFGPAAEGLAMSSRNEAKSLRQKFTAVMASGNQEKLPFIDMTEIHEKNVQLYMSQVTASSSSPAHTPSHSVVGKPQTVKQELDQAGSKLDSLVQTASINKLKTEEETKVKLESYNNEKLLDSIISRVYAKVVAEPTLQGYFSNMSRREINMIKLGFSKAFLGVDNYYFKRTVKKAHEGLGIDKRQFDHFVELFVTAMQEEGVRADDIDTVCRHLRRFADEVIEDDM